MTKPSKIVQELMVTGRTPPGWKFPDEALKDIEDAKAVNAAGVHHVSAMALARALKRAYALPASVETIRKRLKETGL